MSIEKLVGCENHVLPPKRRPYEACQTCTPTDTNQHCNHYVPLTVQQTHTLIDGQQRTIYALQHQGDTT